MKGNYCQKLKPLAEQFIQCNGNQYEQCSLLIELIEHLKHVQRVKLQFVKTLRQVSEPHHKMSSDA